MTQNPVLLKRTQIKLMPKWANYLGKMAINLMLMYFS